MQLCYAQEEVGKFGVVADTQDNFAYLREKPNLKSSITDTLKNGSVFFCHGKIGNWMDAEYLENDSLKGGYIYKDRMKFISFFKPVKRSSITKDQVLLSDKYITVDIAKTDFLKSAHSYIYNRENPSMIDAIDGKNPWGTDGNIPRYSYKYITVKIGDETIHLPKNALENLYEPNLYYTSINYDTANDVLYITAFNSDGAGAYGIVWIIQHKKYKERVLAYPF